MLARSCTHNCLSLVTTTPRLHREERKESSQAMNQAKRLFLFLERVPEILIMTQSPRLEITASSSMSPTPASVIHGDSRSNGYIN